MKIKVSEATGPALNWLVASVELGDSIKYVGAFGNDLVLSDPGGSVRFLNYCRDPELAVAIIEREKIETRHDGRCSWCGWIGGVGAVHGPTMLIAAMRCHVMNKLGEKVNVPKELLK